MGGGRHAIIWPLNSSTKINEKIPLGYRWLTIDHFTHNNQPKTGGRNRGECGGKVRREGGVGEMQSDRFWGCGGWKRQSHSAGPANGFNMAVFFF
jgi:hypothetical protein